MRRPPLPRPRRAALALAVLWALAGAFAFSGSARAQPAAAVPAQAGDADVPRPVQAPHYGDALFGFFQERWFPAITSLMVSQHFARLPTHEDDAELLRGGLLLSYGQHREAGEVFERLVATRPALRDRAWFFLARSRHQRGLFDEAEAALARIGQSLPGTLEDDRRLLHAQLLLARGASAEAAAVLEAAAQRPGASPFARYNRGIALLQSGDVAGGRAALDALGREPSADEETRQVRDRANVALGFSALRDDEPALARDALQRVRLDSGPSNQALLGFGWAAAALKQPERALVPWLELSTRDPGDAAVLESRIAVPHAYAELGARGEALTRYQAAIDAYEAERQSLTEAIAAIREADALAPLLDAGSGDEPGREVDAAPPTMSHAAQLVPLLADHAMQEGLKSHRDLRWFDRNLRDWSDSLLAFDEVLVHRSRAYAERLPQLLARANDAAQGVAALQARRDALAAEVDRAEADADGLALASPAELAMRTRVAELRAALPALGEGAEAASFADRIRRVDGALGWRLAQAWPQRLWDARKALAALGSALDQARFREAALAQAQRDEPQRFERLAGRLAELSRRVAALNPQVVALAREQREVLQATAIAALARSQQRLADYTAQARFALAQLQDAPAELARHQGEADHAPTH
ncbi:tetratricopeptide repeat protein [Ideonella sp. A 288]|uniref:tetratricopeptide repeat protein n=1 Tax=Ideonella sp. A 288 TaxID=1962181 RepID=UPI000B4B9D84|nr:tetratricopeptide repeat protein [Ideonella sp. A 288]